MAEPLDRREEGGSRCPPVDDAGSTPTRRRPRAWLRRFARTTPGIISGIALVVAATCLVAGLVCARQLDGRIARSQAVLDRAEPLAHAAQELYAALSATDTAAATAFLSAGIETTQMQNRYQQALADVAAALADTTAGATDAQTRAALAEISANLTAYTGLVAAAEANNRQKFVVGSSYYREASLLMQTKVLPAAENVFTANLSHLDREQRAVGSTPALGLGLLSGVLVLLGGASVVLSRRTNRRFNIGLVVAAALVLAAVTGIVVATRFAAASIEQSRIGGTETLGRLGSARITAGQARTDENLELIARTAIAAGEASFTDHIDKLTELLAAGPPDAAQAVRAWAAAHDRQLRSYDSGDYAGAVAQTVGSDPGGSAAQFALVEASVQNEIERARSALREQVSTARGWLAWSPTGTLVLMALAGAAVVVGLWPRLKEFL